MSTFGTIGKILKIRLASKQKLSDYVVTSALYYFLLHTYLW